MRRDELQDTASTPKPIGTTLSKDEGSPSKARAEGRGAEDGSALPSTPSQKPSAISTQQSQLPQLDTDSLTSPFERGPAVTPKSLLSALPQQIRRVSICPLRRCGGYLLQGRVQMSCAHYMPMKSICA
jgi:hypothetical protein